MIYYDSDLVILSQSIVSFDLDGEIFTDFVVVISRRSPATDFLVYLKTNYAILISKVTAYRF